MAESKKLTKAQIVSELAERSGLATNAVRAALEALSALAKRELGPKGPGEILVPNLFKLTAKQTAATKDRPGINPFTKQATVIKGKPAGLKVRATPVKALKELLA
jgi:nucleoid DNA-binding protein